MLSTSSNAPVLESSTTTHFNGGALLNTIEPCSRLFSRGAPRFSGGRRPKVAMFACDQRCYGHLNVGALPSFRDMDRLWVGGAASAQ